MAFIPLVFCIIQFIMLFIKISNIKLLKIYVYQNLYKLWLNTFIKSIIAIFLIFIAKSINEYNKKITIITLNAMIILLSV